MPHDVGVSERPARSTSRLLDDTSKAIIAELQRDGRMPYAAIGKAVGLSEAAVRSRVQRLTESGILQVVAVTDPLQLGFAPKPERKESKFQDLQLQKAVEYLHQRLKPPAPTKK